MRKLKLLYAASEAAPFITTGGLGEVAGSLPKALAEKYKNKIDIRIVLPLYQGIVDRSEFEFIGKTSVPLAWRQQYCGVYKTILDDVTYYFVDNEYYFKRSECYGHFDDAERFAFFSKAVLYILPMINFMPDIIHANDWQTSLVPIYLSAKYSSYEGYRDISSIITIHNIEYQGVFDLAISEDVFDLHGKEKDIIEFKGAINLLKGAMETAHIISTVSESYSKEIFDDYYAHGLAEIIQKNSSKIRGILNGIDTEKYNPEDDAEIFENYSAESIQKKNLNKLAIVLILLIISISFTKFPVNYLKSNMNPKIGYDSYIRGNKVRELNLKGRIATNAGAGRDVLYITYYNRDSLQYLGSSDHIEEIKNFSIDYYFCEKKKEEKINQLLFEGFEILYEVDQYYIFKIK